MSRDKKDVKSINVPQVVSYLNHTFAETAQEAFGHIRPANTKGTPLYDFQVEHCYLIDEIQRGPTYMLPKIIGDANNNIAAMRDSEKDSK